MDELAVREKFGQRVRDARESRGWRMEELAQRLGKTKGTVSRIETGKQNVSVAQIMQLADVLGVEIEALFPEGPESKSLVSDQEDDMQAMAVTLKRMALRLEALAVH